MGTFYSNGAHKIISIRILIKYQQDSTETQSKYPFEKKRKKDQSNCSKQGDEALLKESYLVQKRDDETEQRSVISVTLPTMKPGVCKRGV